MIFTIIWNVVIHSVFSCHLEFKLNSEFAESLCAIPSLLPCTLSELHDNIRLKCLKYNIDNYGCNTLLATSDSIWEKFRPERCKSSSHISCFQQQLDTSVAENKQPYSPVLNGMPKLDYDNKNTKQLITALKSKVCGDDPPNRIILQGSNGINNDYEWPGSCILSARGDHSSCIKVPHTYPIHDYVYPTNHRDKLVCKRGVDGMAMKWKPGNELLKQYVEIKSPVKHTKDYSDSSSPIPTLHTLECPVLNRIRANRLFRKLKNRKIVFQVDSVGRGFFFSLVCMYSKYAIAFFRNGRQLKDLDLRWPKYTLESCVLFPLDVMICMSWFDLDILETFQSSYNGSRFSKHAGNWRNGTTGEVLDNFTHAHTLASRPLNDKDIFIFQTGAFWDKYSKEKMLRKDLSKLLDIVLLGRQLHVPVSNATNNQRLFPAFPASNVHHDETIQSISSYFLFMEKPPQKFISSDGAGEMLSKTNDAACASTVTQYDKVSRIIAEIIIAKGIEYGILLPSANEAMLRSYPKNVLAGNLSLMEWWNSTSFENSKPLSIDVFSRTLLAGKVVSYLHTFPYIANGNNGMQGPYERGIQSPYYDCTHYCQTGSESSTMAQLLWHRLYAME